MKVSTGLILALSIVLACSNGADRHSTPAGAPAETAPASVSLHPTAAWLLACRSGQDGFGWFPGDSAFVSTTGMALEALADLGALDSLSGKENLITWLRSRQGADGGFSESEGWYGAGFKLPWGSESALEPTYWALRGLQLLDAAPADPEKAAAFILARQKRSGAYDASEYTLGQPDEGTYTTCWALQALRILGQPAPEPARSVAWLRAQQHTTFRRGGFGLSPDNFYFSTVLGTYYGVQALAVLGAAPEDPDSARHFLLSDFGQEPDGGFETGHGDGWNGYDHYSRMEDTQAAVAALALLGRPLSDSDTSRAARPATDCAAWIAGTQNRDGGFGRFGVTDQTPLAPPSELRATWAAVRALTLLGRPVPRPAEPLPPVEPFKVHACVNRHPVVNCDDPMDVWAFRRIAAPIYYHFLASTGSQTEAIGMLSRWTRAAVGPENYQGERRNLRARRYLTHSWGQCGTMSLVLQALATSVDHAARGAYAFGDANCEVLLQEDGWDKPHWVDFIPFTNEFIPSGTLTPEGTRNGWSALDLVINSRIREKNLNYISLTRLGDHRYWRVWMQAVDVTTGRLTDEACIDTSMTYGGAVPLKMYPGGSW